MNLTVFQRESKIYHDSVNLGKGLKLKENSIITAWETNSHSRVTGQLKGRRHLRRDWEWWWEWVNVLCVQFRVMTSFHVDKKLKIKCSKPRTRMTYKANKHDQQHVEGVIWFYPLGYSHVLWSIAVGPMFKLLPLAQVSG